MKRYLLTFAVMLSTLAFGAEKTTVYRDSRGRTTGTSTERRNHDGTTTTTYRDSYGRTTGTETERKNSDGSTTTIIRDTEGRTIGTKTERKKR